MLDTENADDLRLDRRNTLENSITSCQDGLMDNYVFLFPYRSLRIRVLTAFDYSDATKAIVRCNEDSDSRSTAQFRRSIARVSIGLYLGPADIAKLHRLPLLRMSRANHAQSCPSSFIILSAAARMSFYNNDKNAASV